MRENEQNASKQALATSLRERNRAKMAAMERKKDAEVREEARRYAMRQRALRTVDERQKALHAFHEKRREQMFARHTLDDEGLAELQHLNTKIAHMSGKRRMLALQAELQRGLDKIEAARAKEQMREQAPKVREQLIESSVERRRKRAQIARKNWEINAERSREARERRAAATLANLRRHDEKIAQQKRIAEETRAAFQSQQAYQAHQVAEVKRHFAEVQKAKLDSAHAAATATFYKRRP